MQKLTEGLVVSARGERWRIEAVRAYDRCTLVSLAGADARNPGERRTLIAPFDTFDPVERRRRPALVRLARWRRACRTLVGGCHPPGRLRAAGAFPIDLFPHQLEPALAVLHGLGTRLLLADEVGLGKTMEAGLVAAELMARGVVERMLILTPAGLRDQWQRELESRFGLHALVMDAATLRRRAAALPSGVNPWTTEPIVVASVDYAKRPDAFAGLAGCRWDALVVDEAHEASGDSDRRQAVAAIAARAAYVLLLSATPHNGDPETFAALCGMGAAPGDGPLLVFRRTAREIGGRPVRKVRRLLVRPTRAEARMQRLLARFIDVVCAERGENARLASGVLTKRACSSAAALARTVERRLLVLDGRAEAAEAAQLALPLASDEERCGDDEEPAWDPDLRLNDPRRERRLLGEIAGAARTAATTESKAAALVRLLKRVREPVLVFTEYRDTLFDLLGRLPRAAAVLHGGLDRRGRQAALDAFAGGSAGILLATDAAGAGLNLQRGCRLVVNVELPWNPMRLEQRIGRVDRIGQRRTVHAVHFVARDTPEVAVLDRLRQRVARARAAVGAPDPIGEADPVVAPAGVRDPSIRFAPELRTLAANEASRLVGVRLWADTDAGLAARLAATGPRVARARRAATRAALGNRILLLFDAILEDATGRIVESALVPVLVQDDGYGKAIDRAARAAGDPRVIAAVDASLSEWRHDASAVHARFSACRAARETGMDAAGDVSVPAAAPLQGGLFDRRADAEWRRRTLDREATDRERDRRAAALAASGRVRFASPRLLLALIG